MKHSIVTKNRNTRPECISNLFQKGKKDKVDKKDKEPPTETSSTETGS